MKLSSTSHLKTVDRNEYTFTDADFCMIADLAKRRFGLHLQETKKSLVYSRLTRRLRELNLSSFHEYCTLLQASENHKEQSHLLSSLTTNVTSFYREKHHFDQLRQDILPNLLAKAQSGNSIRIWSAACSAGQEAYCLAATVLEVCNEANSLNVKILATDIDPVVLERAKGARYHRDQVVPIPPNQQSQLFNGIAEDEQFFEVRPPIRNLVSFRLLNLIEDWPMQGFFDVIMCRNAAIYFDKKTQDRLWLRFCEKLKTGGHLMIGHSERLSGEAADKFQNVGITAYQKHE